MFQWLKQLEGLPRFFFVVAALAVVAAVGLVDYLANREITFSVFYLVAVGLAAWFVGKWFARFIAVLSVVVSVAGDFATGPKYGNPLVPYWNASIVLAFYLIVAWLLAKLHWFYDVLEARVKQRTLALTDEIAERERLEHELLAVSEREQRRIGHDLHDSLCQHLTGAALAGQVLEEKLSARRLPEASDANRVVELVEEGIVLSRKLARGLDPVEMKADGLMQALEELAAVTTELFKISCRFECDSPVLVHNPVVSGHLYRIAQEAVSNAIKHGKARNVVIQLEGLEDGTVLHVKDDGIGLPEPLPKTAGMGLRIMAHRASMVGAKFSARRDESGGTLVSCTLNSNQPAAAIPRE